MVPPLKTLSDLWPRFQGHDIFEVEYRKNGASKDKVTIAQEETIPNIWNGTMFGDLDWPLNASCGFVSISWASSFLTHGVLFSLHAKIIKLELRMKNQLRK